ncbi:regulator of telomere elongation helicase 1-like isoform X2 [Patiria miniata]|uniref:Regulator of telomere elongation helicase 1 homolog n=1 Tax=Patiria miniata TaxID=46514 RepID=A0A914A1U4_PATMI|nr:regulator of telomere elongation helicase 1-like isoform X2 [Patiria miniata]
MPVIKCKGVSIEFPFDPYDCQQDYMNKVVECLQSGKNGILESPTGTGKTLCLLCSALAWRNTYISQQELGRCLQGDGGGGGQGDGGGFRQKLAAELKEGAGTWADGQEGMFVDRPRIIYASRTHSQLSQAVDQLKDTAYRPRVAVIGSREQLCIHPDVQKAESNSVKVHMCRAKVDSRMCHFYNSLDQKKADKAFTDNILDIEDLVKLGNTHKVCPYYMARELKTNADIVFMPYNYLLDSKARRIHGVELQGNVVIFDEAHNVERMCEESASFDLTSFDLASCVEETDHLLKKTVEVEMCNQQFRAADAGGEGEFDASALATLKKLFLDLENEINSMNPPEAGITKPGSFIYELFAKVRITFDTKVELLQLLEKIVSHLTTSSTAFHNKAAGLQKFCDVINIVFNKDTPSGSVSEASRCYKVHVRASAPQKKSGRTDLWTSNNPAKAKKQGYTLSYWCFSPGFSMKDLVSQGVRSIILTSGTLSPLNSFKSELQIDFPIQLENPHVISRNQMTVAVMTKGPDGTVLNSSYNTRFNRDYVMSLGNAIVNFSRLVPNGLLVFFPSYPVMNHALDQWQESGIQHRITQYKEVFVEPKGKVNFIATIESFYEKINDPKLNGACFFAVCRGKVSEGLDFADINGRAVVITGLPFPPRMDPKIVLKMQYLDETRRRNHSSLSGQDWYRQQASRAVNQAIGRVIRHKEDFGAILLCDTRFSNREARNQLPSWVRPYVNVYDQFGKGVKDLTNFFKETERTMPKPQPKQARSSAPVRIDQAQCGQQYIATSSSSSAPPTKAKYIDTHVPSLKRNRDGSHVSEAQLKIMYEDSRPKPAKKSAGLLNALSSVENTPEEEEDGFLSQRSSQSNSQQTKLIRRLDQQKKKKKIVIKQQNGLDSVDKTLEAPQPAVAGKPEIKGKEGNVSLASAQDYIAQVKKTLSQDSYKTFSGIMQKYKKTDNFSEMVAGIADLFTEDESKYPLFRNFYTFARPHHKKQFHSLCLSLTGQGCGYKPEHSIPQKKMEKQKPTNLISSNKSKSSLPEKTFQQNGPISCQGMTTGKAGNPTKRHKPDSLDLDKTSAEKDRAESHHSELQTETMPRKGLLRDGSLSGAHSFQLHPKRGVTAESSVDPDKPAAKGPVQSLVKSAILSKKDSRSIQMDAERSSASQLEADKSTVNSDDVLENVGPAVDGESVRTGALVCTFKKPLENKPMSSRQEERSSKTRCQEEKSCDGRAKEEMLGDDKSVTKSSDRAPSKAVSISERRPCPEEYSGEKGLGSQVRKRSDSLDSRKSSNRDCEVTSSQSQAAAAFNPHSSTSNPTAATIKLSSQTLDGPEQPQPVTHTDSSRSKPEQTLHKDDPCYSEEPKDEFRDSLGDEEEPMSLESSMDEDVILNASEELFDDTFNTSDPVTGKTDVLLGNETASRTNLGTDANPSLGEKESVKICNQPGHDQPVTQGPNRLRIQKMVDHVKRSISNVGSPKKQMHSVKTDTCFSSPVKDARIKSSSNEQAESTETHLEKQSREIEPEANRTITGKETASKTCVHVEKHHSQEIVSQISEKLINSHKIGDMTEQSLTKENENRTLHRKKIKSCSSSKTKLSGSQDDFKSPSRTKSSKKINSQRSPSKLSRKRQAENCPEITHKKKLKEDETKSKKLISEHFDEEHSDPKEGEESIQEDVDCKKLRTPHKKLKKLSKLNSECKSTTSSPSQSVDFQRQAGTPKSKKEKLNKKKSSKLVDSSDSKHTPATSTKVQKGPNGSQSRTSRYDSDAESKEKSLEKRPAEVEDNSKVVSKESFLGESASSSHSKRTGDCALCKKTAWPAYRGPCGHVSCQTCWQAYIREFHECPACGSHTEEKHLVAV